VYVVLKDPGRRAAYDVMRQAFNFNLFDEIDALRANPSALAAVDTGVAQLIASASRSVAAGRAM
jgi:hypothetical protein